MCNIFSECVKANKTNQSGFLLHPLKWWLIEYPREKKPNLCQEKKKQPNQQFSCFSNSVPSLYCVSPVSVLQIFFSTILHAFFFTAHLVLCPDWLMNLSITALHAVSPVQNAYSLPKLWSWAELCFHSVLQDLLFRT